MSQTSEMLFMYREARRRLMGTPPKHSPTERQSITQLAEVTALYEDAIDVIATQAREIEQLKKSLLPQPSPEQIEQYESVMAGRLTFARIQRVVANRFGISRVDIISARRTMNIVRPRQIAMYLAKKLTIKSLPEIGLRFGGKDHTTVLHASRKVADLIESSPEWADEVRACEAAVLDGLAVVAP